MPDYLTDEDVGLSTPNFLTDEDVGLSTPTQLTDEDVGLGESKTEKAIKQSFGTFATGEFGVTPEITPEHAVAQPEIYTKPIVSLPRIPIGQDENVYTAFGKQAINNLIGLPEFLLSPVGEFAPMAGAVAPDTIVATWTNTAPPYAVTWPP